MAQSSSSEGNQSYFRYWGKARPRSAEGARYHLLPFHCLDVAACGQELLRLPRFGLHAMSQELRWSPETLTQVFVAFLAMHDVGKFSRAFQELAKDLGAALVDPNKKTSCQERHDTMGWVFLEEYLSPVVGPDYDHSFWSCWIKFIAGHHGLPPKEHIQANSSSMFLREDLAAGQLFLRDVFALLHPHDLPPTQKADRCQIKRLSWRLAGLAVLADWLGSNAASFPYQSQPQPLREYWETAALPRAREAVRAAGFGHAQQRSWSGPGTLFHFPKWTPLQRYAASVELASGPQLFLLEDVTGAGKTEAALLLVHRLMAAGHAHGFYFGLPTMATANQLYDRVGRVYRKLYEDDASPSLVLSHGANHLVPGFRESVLNVAQWPTERSRNGVHDEPLAGSAQCAAWLADSRKKAMLADLGVGTVDQALLGVLPVRHQSLRLLGLSHKVLILDEVHAYDAYTGGLLQGLVKAQATAGGSTILLSATVHSALRRDLIRAYRSGVGLSQTEIASDLRYPLATHVTAAGGLTSQSFATRDHLVRSVGICTLSTVEEALDWVLTMASAGRAVCWIRNTVHDALKAYGMLRGRMNGSGPERKFLQTNDLTLFHARFAMGDRLAIEQQVLRRFGNNSNAKQRCGQVLIATQVVEQSLDLDFDELLTDLAPVDLLIQRAGRLHRHLRRAGGDLAEKTDGRGKPVLHLLAPPRDPNPRSNWYSALLPKAQSVYEDTGKLWLTLEALLDSGRIVSPGMPGEPGSVRALLEKVYNDETAVPDNLLRETSQAQGKRACDKSLSALNLLNLGEGYGGDSSNVWHDRVETPTRLGDESERVYLAREREGALVPLIEAEHHPWEMSAMSLPAEPKLALAPEWQTRFAPMLAVLRQQIPLLADPEVLVVPLVPQEQAWTARCLEDGKPVQVGYSPVFGLTKESGQGA